MGYMTMPSLDIRFKSLAGTAIQRGTKGNAILIVKDSNVGDTFLNLRSIGDFTSEIQKTFSDTNVQYIKDVLSGTPQRVQVLRIKEDGETEDEKEGEEVVELTDKDGDIIENNDSQEISSLADMLQYIGVVSKSRNSWIAMADATSSEQEDLISFVKSENKENHKRYKLIVHDAVSTDDMRIINFTNETVTFKSIKDKDGKEIGRGTVTGDKFVPYLLGFIAGYPLNMSLIATPIQVLERVSPIEKPDDKLQNGEFFLVNDEGDIRVARAINSLSTISEDLSYDMRFILIVEVMDLIYVDIYNTWKDFYKAKYKNRLDNQMLFISAVNTYFDELSNDDGLLDLNFDNKCMVNVEKQRRENKVRYPDEDVDGWTDNRVMEMTIGTQVFLNARIKILNAMEDLSMDILM